MPDHELNDLVKLLEADLLPIVNGMLLVLSPERYMLCFDQIRGFIRKTPACHFILTIGPYNQPPRPVFYDLYSQFAQRGDAGQILMCAQTYALDLGAFRLSRTMDFPPLVTGWLTSTELVDTIFGQAETSTLWYSSYSVNYVDPHARLDAMTDRSEVPFWFSPAGFLYLSHQAALIRAFKMKSRRIVVYSRLDLNDEQFLKLLFTFEALGIELEFVYDKDLIEFADEQDIGPINIFSRAGDNSFIVINQEPHYSGRLEVAQSIQEVQNELIGRPGVHHDIDRFMTAFQALIVRNDKQDWRRRAATARGLFEKFASYPTPVQQAILETYVERWRSL
ncbi:hypothetical protein [Nonomuraea cavernae]|uniref:hypothetical protein n=1 Tax=Nonomuraea cavernae TaxID=2045107 RepID=UPI00166F608F|nr:hypothetical protein [Nonomuraea cavernae]MCA2183665.1 hypothetical protein [Nonomuraea cavernae]